MQVLKFGGTSVADAQMIGRVADIVAAAADRDRTVAVFSAISGCTNTLIEVGRRAAARDESYLPLIDGLQEAHHDIIHSLLPIEKYEESLEVCDREFDSLRSIAKGVYLLGELSATSLDAIQGTGELLSSRIIATKFASMGIATKWLDARNIIRTSYAGGKNEVDTAATFANMADAVDDNPIVNLFIVPGFVASDEQGRTTTLGRGGSDYTASLLAVALKARLLEIWTDVPGMMTANPKTVPSARTISHISYRAALELSHFGAKVIYPPTIQPVVAEGIPIYVKSTFAPELPGTLIERQAPRIKEDIIGISNSDDIALLSLEGSGMVGVPGFSSRLFAALSRENINIILITQASSVHTMCLAVAASDAEKARAAADKCFEYEISLGILNRLKVETGYSIVSLVADDVVGKTGTTGRMLAALGRHSIQVRAVAQGSSERNVTVVVSSDRVEDAIRQIHDEFFDRSYEKQINLFVAGFGTVGRSLVEIINREGESIARRTGKRIKVCGLSNSRKFVVDIDGLDISKARELLDGGCSAADDAYFERLAEIFLENAIFVDCTASSDIAYKYVNLFRSGYSIVACNKISFSSPYKLYETLRNEAVRCGVTLRYETTVGAALPILESITRSLNSGDHIDKVEAVLSGTLNYIFSTYRGGTDGVTFAQVVKQAQELGYTEPDPRLDLSGRDVLRKLLILSRQAGVALDEEDVELVPLLGPEYFSVGISEFYDLLAANESGFAASYEAAASKGLHQRFVASLVSDPAAPKGYRAHIGLDGVDSAHPLYNLNGTDNSAIIRTDFYPSPLVVQGAGAGARQTASGVLNDILL